MPVDPTASIAPTARIHPDAVIGPGCSIGEFVIVEQDVVLGAQCILEPYAMVKRWTTMGDRNRFGAGTILGTDPLDKGFSGERSYLRIGSGNNFREHWTVSRGTAPESVTEIGDDNYFMTGGHVAHNCKVGSRTIIASCTLVAGYAEVEDQAFISGGVVVHQFSLIGRLAMIGGNVRVNKDVPPFFLYAAFNVAPVGLNVVGLRRAGFTAAQMRELKLAYRLLYRSGLKQDEALERIETECPGEHARHLVSFIRRSKRGICRPDSHHDGEPG